MAIILVLFNYNKLVESLRLYQHVSGYISFKDNTQGLKNAELSKEGLCLSLILTYYLLGLIIS